jgi:hypothetical protein
MSFILDALKKAETERQRQSGPTLLEVRVTPPRRRIPLWTLIISALLGVNILLLLLFLLRRPASNVVPPPESPAAAAVPAAPAAAAPSPINTSPTGLPVATAPNAAPVAVPALQGVSAADPGAIDAAAAAAAVPPGSVRQPDYSSAVTTPTVSSGPAELPSMPDVAVRGGIGGGPAGDNPADYEPAVSAAGTAAAGTSSRRGADAEPPSLSDISGDMPSLRLDLHVYATRPADRYALINMHRVREGDVLPEGPRVVAIDRDGVELNYRGTAFMLHPQ